MQFSFFINLILKPFRKLLTGIKIMFVQAVT
jgi:hypothetical protein